MSKIIWEREYHENGQLRCEIPLFNGRIHGTTRWYWPNGQLADEILFVNGHEHKKSTSFYKNGHRRCEIENRYGQKHGIARWYHPNGRLSCEAIYIDGVACGPRIYYNSQEQVECIYYFWNNKEITKEQWEAIPRLEKVIKLSNLLSKLKVYNEKNNCISR